MLKVKVSWTSDTVAVLVPGEKNWIWRRIKQAKRLQQLLQRELGVPGDLPKRRRRRALAKQKRSTAGVTGAKK